MNRLPSEIISYIARCILDGEVISRAPKNNLKGEGTVDTSSIVPLTHVCRHWREAIISTPENWTLISSRSGGLTSLSLQRAKAAPLEIRLDMRQVRENPGFSALITPHIRNTGTLLIGYVLSIEELVQTLQNFPQSMPNLRSLTLTRESESPNRDWSIDPFGPSIPALTHLSLKYIPLYPAFLHLRTLTSLTLSSYNFNLHLDTLLDFLEENHSLNRLNLCIGFAASARRSSRRQAPIRNRLQSLVIFSVSAMDANALISNIALKCGAHLNITLYDPSAGLNDLPSAISMTHLSNLRSPTLVKYDHERMSIRLLGPNGSFSLEAFNRGDPFAGFPPAHFANVRTFQHSRSELAGYPLEPIVFYSSSLPTLETLVVENEATVSFLLSDLFSDPSSSPSLRILAFFDCDLNENFMEELTLFASDRKKTTSAWLYRVVIVNSKGILPRFASIKALRKHVPVVDVQIGEKLPASVI